MANKQRVVGDKTYSLEEVKQVIGEHACTLCQARGENGCIHMGTDCMLPGNSNKVWRRIKDGNN